MLGLKLYWAANIDKHQSSLSGNFSGCDLWANSGTWLF
jgi:hypothetical protein